MSPGWQSRTWQSFSRVAKRIPRALPVLRIDRLAGVIPICLASSLEVIPRWSITIPKVTLITVSPPK